MPEAEDAGSGSPKVNANRDVKQSRLSSSPQLAFPSVNPGRLPSPSPGGSSSSSGRHSHSRSKSVNLSPTISGGSSAFPSTALRFDGYPPESSNSLQSAAMNLPSSSTSHHLSHLQAAPRIGSPLLQPSSPMYVNVPGLNAGGVDHWRSSPNYSSSESGSSEGSSPEIRRGSHFAKSMERSSSANSIGSNGSTLLAPQSPRSSHRRTASPSRAYAVPVSPRLQAFGGGGGGHTRKLSGGNSHHLALGETLLRPTSPMSNTPNLSIDTNSELPIDSVWPANNDNIHSNQPHGTEAIPIGASKGLSTPIPPSLREDLSVNNLNVGITSIPYPSPSSPNLRRKSLSSSPQDQHFIYRDQRTPSPSGWGTRRDNKLQSPSSSKSLSSPSSHHISLAAPKAISKRALNLEEGSYSPQQLSQSGRSARLRSHSNSSTESDPDVNDESGSSSTSGDSPTLKVLRQPESAQAKLDAQHAVAEVSSGTNPLDSDSSQSESNSNKTNSDHREEPRFGSSSEVPFPPSSMSSLESTKAIASAHGISQSNHSLEPAIARNIVQGRGINLPMSNGNVVFGHDGHLLRARSPASISPMLESVPLSESPPKTRSFIGMPPRSGYELSDDPDDVGSEDGSTGSGRESIGTNEDRENDDDDDNEVDEGDRVDDQDRKSRLEDGGEGVSQLQQELGNRFVRPAAIPRRPSLTQSAIVAPVPSNAAMAKAIDYQEGEQLQWKEEHKPAAQHRTDLGLTRNDGVDEDEEDDDDNEKEGMEVKDGDQTELSNESPFGEEETVEESLSTLERIFLFAKSEMAYHRVLVSHSLADWILEVELSDAVEFVIPLLNGLACDENDVCTAFAPHLHRVMWHFFRNCPLVEDETEQAAVVQKEEVDESEGQEQSSNGLERATRPKLSVAVFTPLLCALLLNSDAAIAGSTQTSIVQFFARLQGLSFLDNDQVEDENIPEEERQKEQQQQFSSGKAQAKEAFDMDTALIRDAAAREEKRIPLGDYAFGERPRQMIMDELLHHVALAIGNLNVEQTMQARENGPLQVFENQQQEEGLNQEIGGAGGGGDAVMDDVPLITETSDEVSFSGNDAEEDAESQVAKDRPQLPSLEFEDTEMSLDMMEEGQESGDVAIGATTASLDNVSMTMSDVEEEVAVGRMASLSLLSALGAEDLVNRTFLVDQIVPEMMKFASDQTFFVRKEVAVSMGALANVIGFDVIKQMDFLSIFETFCADRVWHVRQAACLSLPNLFAQIKDQELKRSKVVEIMRVFVGDVSRNVRVAALDIIGELIYLFHEDTNGVPPELVRHFLGESFDVGAEDGDQKMDTSTMTATSSSMTGNDSYSEASQDGLADFGFGWGGGLSRSNSTANADGPSGWSSDGFSAPMYKTAHNNQHMDPDRPLVMAYNFPAVIFTLGKSHWPKLKAVHSQLCGDPSSKVRRSLAASLHEVAKIIGIDWTTDDLLEVFQRFLDSRFEKDEEVKMAMLQNVDVLMDQLTLAKGLESLKFLLNLWNEEPNGDSSRFSSNWRLRVKIISLIPHLAKRYLLEDDEGILVVLMQSAIVDNVSSVRIQGIKVVSSLYHIFEDHDQVLADGFLGMLVDVGENESYRGRVACLQSLAELCKNRLQRSSVEMLVMNRLVELSKDSVVDVRIAVAQLVSLMCTIDELYALPNSRSEDFIALLRRLSHDEASLVRDMVLSKLSEDDPGRATPVGTPLFREARQLILGPADGSQHRPAPSQSSFDMNGDATQEVQSFAMDEEDDGRLNGLNCSQSLNSFPIKDNSPSLVNSTLMKRRFFNRSYQQPSMKSDADSSMFEDADEDEDDEDEDSRREGDFSNEDEGNQIQRTGFGTLDGEEEEMITIPSPDNFLMLSSEIATAQHQLGNQFSFTGDDSFDGEEEESPHHLLGISNENDSSPLRMTVKHTLDGSPEQERRMSPHGLSLESPERPWTIKSGDDDDDDNVGGSDALVNHQSTIEGSSLLNTKKIHHDPFLAFVADKRYDQGSSVENPAEDEEGGDEKEGGKGKVVAASNQVLSSPAGGRQKELIDK